MLQEHHRLLLHRARLHSADPADAEDALNEASLAFLRNYNGPPGEDALNWLKAVTKYTAWSLSRDFAERRDRPRMRAKQPDGPARTFEADERLRAREALGDLLRHLQRLKPDERTALVLLGFGFTYREIAELRSWSRRKTARCIFEGRRRLRTIARGEAKNEKGGSIP